MVRQIKVLLEQLLYFPLDPLGDLGQIFELRMMANLRANLHLKIKVRMQRNA